MFKAIATTVKCAGSIVMLAMVFGLVGTPPISAQGDDLRGEILLEDSGFYMTYPAGWGTPTYDSDLAQVATTAADVVAAQPIDPVLTVMVFTADDISLPDNPTSLSVRRWFSDFIDDHLEPGGLGVSATVREDERGFWHVAEYRGAVPLRTGLLLTDEALYVIQLRNPEGAVSSAVFDAMLDSVTFDPVMTSTPTAPESNSLTPSMLSGQPLENGDVIEGTLPDSGDQDVYTFESNDGAYATLRVETDQEFGMGIDLELYADDTLWASNGFSMEDTVNPLLPNVRLPTDRERFTVIVKANADGQPYTLSLQLTETPIIDELIWPERYAGELTIGSTVLVLLDAERRSAVFRYDASADSTITVTVEAVVPAGVDSLDAVDPVVHIFDVYGVRLVRNDDYERDIDISSRDAQIANFVFPEDGTYFITVGRWSEPGEVQVSVGS